MISKISLIGVIAILFSFSTVGFGIGSETEKCKPTQEEILNLIDEMSVQELSDLIQALESKFGVSANGVVNEFEHQENEK